MDLYIKNGNAEQAVEIAQRNGMVSGKDDPLILAIHGACKAAKREWTPALAYLQSAYLMGCHGALCLRWLAVTLLSNGQAEAARPVLDEWQKLEPANPELLAYIAAVRETQNAICIKKEEEAVGKAKTAVRQYRVDPGSSIAEVNPIKIPLIEHVTSSEMSITEDT